MKKFNTIIWLGLLFLLIMLAVLSAEPIHEYSGWYITAAVVPLFYFRNKHSLFLRFLFLLTVSFVTLRYLAFRSLYTLDFESKIALVLGVILFIAELYSALVHFVGIAVNIAPKNRKKAPLPKKLPSVDIFIPTYNEDENIAVITATACKNLDYPKELLNIYILNDGGRLSILNNPEKQEAAYQRHLSLSQKAKELGVHYLTRENGDKAKAGMINEALCGRAFSSVSKDKSGLFVGGKPQKTNGDLVLILDCDHIPATDFLQETVGYFAQNPKLFLVQTPHFMINREPMRKNLDYDKTIPAEGYLFYHFDQRGMDRWNASFFCGSAAVLRRSILEENGGLEGETITEDCETALKLHGKGYDSVFVDKPMIAGLETENFESFLGQRTRWCKGMLQILLLKNPLFMKGLSFMQRLSYLSNCLFWLFPLFRYIFVLAPLAFLYLGINIYNATFLQVINYVGPHLVCSILVGYYLYPKARGFLYSEVLETVQMICLLPATVSVLLNPKKPTFNITAKGLNEKIDYTSIRIIPFLIFFALIVGGFAKAVYIYFDYPLLLDSVLLTGFWNLFNFFVIVACIGIMWEKKKEYKDFSVPLKPNDTIQIENHKAELKRLSVSEMEFDLPSDITLEQGKDYTIFSPNGSKTEIKIEEQNKTRVTASVNNQLSPDNIRFVFGDSSRWQSVYTMYENQKTKLPVSIYIVKSSLKNCLSIFKNYFKLMIIFGILFCSAAAHAETLTVPLAQIKGHDYTYFNNIVGSSSLPFYLSSRWDTKQATLFLYYKYPSSLNSKNFSFKFSIQETELSAEPKGDNLLSVNIPHQMLQKGINELLIAFRSNLTSEDCTLNEQVVSLDLKKSYLYFDYDILPPQKSSDVKLSDIFDAKDLDAVKLNIVYDKLDTTTLREALKIASKSAVEAANRNILLNLSTSALPNNDNIVLADASCNSDTTLCFDGTKLGGDAVFKQHILEQGKSYRLSELEFGNKMFKRSKDQKSLSFVIPSASYLSPNKYVTLKLDLVLGNHIKPKSKLKVLVNGKNVAEVILRSAKGKEVKEHEVKFRASLLRKGTNNITFLADIAADNSDVNCLSPKNEGIFITLFSDSTIEIPEMGYLVELPNLKFLFNDGYPFDGKTDIFVEKLTPYSALAVIKTGAFLAQKRGTLPQASEIYEGKPLYKGRNMVSFETDESLADDILIISQQWIENTDNLIMTYKAKSFEKMSLAADMLWNAPLFENVDGDTMEINFAKSAVKSYNTASHKEISGNIGIQKNISFLSNNNILLFYALLIITLISAAAWLRHILKGLEDDE